MKENSMFKRLSIFALVLCMSAAMSFGVFIQTAHASSQVELYSAKMVTDYTSIGTIQGYYSTGYIAIQNLSYQKNVTVHYTYDGTTWKDATATYVTTASDGYEVWSFQTEYKAYAPPHQYDYWCKFAVKYEVNGQTYWDNNNGNDYFLRMSSIYTNYPYVLSKSVVQLDSANRSSDGTVLTGKLFFKNLGNPKTVKVRYTTDNWATYTDADASYLALYQNGVEAWDFYVSNLPSGAAVKYAIYYTVNGVTYWDNNFGLNYAL